MREAGREGGLARLPPPVTTVALNQPHTQSYREVLQQLWVSKQSHEHVRSRARFDTSVVNLRGAVGPKSAGSAANSVGFQRPDDGGRCVVSLQEEMAHRALMDMKKKMGELQGKIDRLKRCVEENKGADLDLGVGCGLIKGNKMGSKDIDESCSNASMGQANTSGPHPVNLNKGKARIGSGPSFGPQPIGQLNTKQQEGFVWRR